MTSTSIGLPSGVILEPGERVLVWSESTGHTKNRILGCVLGLVLAIALVGLLLIYQGLRYKKWRVYSELVTDRRFIQVYGDGRIVIMSFEAITKVTTVMQGYIVKYVCVESPHAKPMDVTTTKVGAFDAQVPLAEFLTRRTEIGFLASIEPSGHAAKLAT